MRAVGELRTMCLRFPTCFTPGEIKKLQAFYHGQLALVPNKHASWVQKTWYKHNPGKDFPE